MLAYSTVGRTNDLKACSLIEVDAMLRFRQTTLTFLLALLQVLFICSPQSSWSFMAHPRYFADLTSCKIHDRVVCKQADSGFKSFWYVINEVEE